MANFATPHGDLYYEILEPEHTDAPWITLLHNFMSTGRAAWGVIADRCTKRYRVLLPDLPGHGRSIGHPPSFQHLEMGRQIANLMSSVGADTGHLAGCSSGGMIAELIVEEALADPATLTLVSSTYSVNPETTGEGSVVHPKDFRAGRDWMDATARLHDPYRYDGYFEDVLLNRFQRLQPEWVIDLPLESLADWQLPVCLIHGADDEFFPVSIVQAMAQILPHAELTVVPGQSHGLIFRRPGRVRAVMTDFLNRHPVRQMASDVGD